MSGGGAPRPSNSAKRRSRVTISPSPRLRRPSPRSTSPKPQGVNEVALWYLRCLASGSRQIDRGERYPDKDFPMIARLVVTLAVLTPCLWMSCCWVAHAQDVPGIEICTAEKTMERRTSCLQSNVNFLQATINKLNADHQQKLDADNRQVDALKATVVSLQKSVADLQAAQKKMADDPAKKADAPSKDSAPAKSGGK